VSGEARPMHRSSASKRDGNAPTALSPPSLGRGCGFSAHCRQAALYETL